MSEGLVDERLSVEFSGDELSSMLSMVVGAVDVEEVEDAAPMIASTLRGYGLVSATDLSKRSIDLFWGFEKADREIQLNVMAPGLTEYVRAFIASGGSTVLRGNGCDRTLVERLELSEVPRELAGRIRLLTGLAGENLTVDLPHELVLAAYGADHEAVSVALSGAVPDEDDLGAAVRSGDWMLRLMKMDRLENGQPITEDLVLLLSIGTRLFSIEPDPSERGVHRADTVLPMSVWARMSGWFTPSSE